MNWELKKIKKLYGEDMMHFCRQHFASILEREGILIEFLLSKFYPTHFLFSDIKEARIEKKFKIYIHYQLLEKDTKKNNTTTKKIPKHPRELLKEAGYDFYECHTEEEIQAFKKYYTPEEELCTFWKRRLDTCRVFWIVKENVSDIKRENFTRPNREDLYGTSVLSIQFTKDRSHVLSIKNRYNHTVRNPDATYSNDLERIIPGLTDAFSYHYGLRQRNIHEKFCFPDECSYVQATDGRFYRYNFEFRNIYYCPDNVILDHFKPVLLDKSKYLLLYDCVLDLEGKEIYPYDQPKLLYENTPGLVHNAFSDTLQQIEKIVVIKNKKEKGKFIHVKMKYGCAQIELDPYDNILSYENDAVIEVWDRFCIGKKVRTLNFPNAGYIGNDFMKRDMPYLQKIELPNVAYIGNGFLENQEDLSTISLPEVEYIGNDFLKNNYNLYKIDIPKLEEVGMDFLKNNQSLIRVCAPKLKEAGDGFLDSNDLIEKDDFPLLEVGDDSFYNQKNIKMIEVVLKKR